ncbi:MAG TPA: hypothetical protein VFX12_02570 [Vicinamibacterales bacterium]|nr:hypothetical protein [Vicinamibacterales bacterium]
MLDVVREVGDAARCIRRRPRIVATLVVTFALAVATWAPVRRAVSIDPTVLLREE